MVKIGDIVNKFAESDPKEKIKQDILGQFKSINADVGHVLPPNWLPAIYIPSLNPKEKAVLQEAIDELISEGLVVSKGDNLALTEKGVDAIY
ncbi:hypothetical protein D1BOALGB6SA_8227 [Olavius sp. associated proteobacterium Delta 1]|nr:hypothetical protein D1BOALGB6SA_8227 [Olavius sp. associated proteobacterium Delta 1]